MDLMDSLVRRDRFVSDPGNRSRILFPLKPWSAPSEQDNCYFFSMIARSQVDTKESRSDAARKVWKSRTLRQCLAASIELSCWDASLESVHDSYATARP